MRRVRLVALLAILGLAGCVESSTLFGDNGPAAGCGASSATSGRNPATGMCVMFSSTCDVPAGWAACTPYVACTDSSMCLATEHCQALPAHDPGVPEMACVRNPTCAEATDCASGMVCDTSVQPPAAPPCDPMQPDCRPAGTCSSGNPQPPPPPPGIGNCQATSECGALEICPAQYGGCSKGDENIECPSVCERACTADADCGDPTTMPALRCNAADVCGASNADAMGNPGLACAGWCVLRP